MTGSGTRVNLKFELPKIKDTATKIMKRKIDDAPYNRVY